MKAEYVLSQISTIGDNEDLFFMLSELITACQKEIHESAAKAKGGNSLLKRTRAAVKYLNNIDQRHLKGVWIDNDFQCLSNNYTGFILSEPLEGFPEIDKPMDLFEHVPDTSHYITVDVDIADVKAALKIHNAKHPNPWNRPVCTYDIHNSRYMARHIIDCYDILGGDIVFQLPENGAWKAAILSSENGKAILLPWRKKS